MRVFKLVSALIAALAFSAVAVATASAAETLWRLLPGSTGETFKGQQIGEMVWTLQGGGTVKCKKGSISLGEVMKEGSTEEKDATLESALMRFEGCASAGIFYNTLGDASSVVLMSVKIHNCVISKANKEFGWLITVPLMHVEVPVVALLITLEGSFVARIAAEGATKHNFLVTAKSAIGEAGKKQDPDKCEGDEKEILKIKDDATPFETVTLDAVFLIEFDLTKDKAGEEMME